LEFQRFVCSFYFVGKKRFDLKHCSHRAGGGVAALELNGRGSSPSAESFSAVGFVRKLSSVGEAGSLAEYICASKNGALGEFLSSKTRCFAKTGSGQIQGKVKNCVVFLPYDWRSSD
jgi:hypothetical protein